VSAHHQWTRIVDAQLAALGGLGATGRDGHTRVECPACPTRAGKRDYEGSFSVRNSNGWGKCHRCRWRTRVGGDWARFDVVELEPEDLDACGVEQPSDYTPVTDPAIRLAAPHVIQYLFERRIRQDVVEAARIGYAMDGDHAGRLILPAVDAPDWRQVGWVGRMASTTSKRRRYHQAAGMDTRSVFFNDDRLGDPSSAYNVVVEGAIDSLRHWPICLGAWGKPKDPQLERLILSGRPTIFAGDADAWCEYHAAALMLRCHGVPSWCLRFPTGVDPALVPRKVFLAGVEHCLTHKTDTDLAP